MNLRNRAGIVLPAVVFVLLIVELLAVAALAIAYGESAVANQMTAAARAELTARDGLISLLNDTLIRPQPRAPGTSITLPAQANPDGTTHSVSLERLSAGVFLARAEGSYGLAQRRIRSRVALLFEIADPLAILAQFPGAFGTAGAVNLVGTAVIDGSSSAATPSQWLAPNCSTWLPPSLAGAGVTLAPVTTFDRLGYMALSTVQQLADRQEGGVLDLMPVGGPDCLRTASGNWGAPLDPAHPCADFFPLIYSAGDLTVASGSGQGILVVDGNLQLSAGIRFFGLVLVRGRLIMAPGAEIDGAVLVQSAALPSIIDNARILRSDCAIARALQQSPALNHLAPRRGRSWIPHF
jgi:hypothetical protein